MSGGDSKVVMVTGASRGLGRATALYLAERGHTVYAAMRNTHTSNAAVAADLRAFRSSQGHVLHVVDMDVIDQASVDSAFERILRDTHIDVLVNNVGVMNVGVTEAYGSDELRLLFENNVFSAARTIRAVLPHMRARKSGLLVTVSSIAARVVFPFFGSYCASKAALEVLAETYRYELAPFGIDSVIVQPGPHRTDLISNSPAPRENAGVLNDYEAHLKLQQRIVSTFKTFQDTHDISRPGGVAEAIVALINVRGKRPLRTLVGADFGVREINEAVAPLQEGFMRQLHLEEML